MKKSLKMATVLVAVTTLISTYTLPAMAKDAGITETEYETVATAVRQHVEEEYSSGKCTVATLKIGSTGVSVSGGGDTVTVKNGELSVDLTKATNGKIHMIVIPPANGDATLGPVVNITTSKGTFLPSEAAGNVDPACIFWDFGNAETDITLNRCGVGIVLAPKCRLVATDGFTGQVLVDEALPNAVTGITTSKEVIVHHDAEVENAEPQVSRITVVDKPAWEERITIPEKITTITVVDTEAWEERILHPAETHEEKIVDEAAWTEQITHEGSWHWEKVVDAAAWTEEILHDAVTHEQKIVDQEAWEERIEHPEEYHYEYDGPSGEQIKVVDKEAWEEIILHEETFHMETIIDQEEWVEIIEHPEESHMDKIVDIQPWVEIIEHDEVFHMETIVDKDAWLEVIQHPAVTHEENIVEPAKEEIIKHPEESHEEETTDGGEYKTREISPAYDEVTGYHTGLNLWIRIAERAVNLRNTPIITRNNASELFK